MKKAINNKKGEVGCVALLLLIAVVIIILFTEVISDLLGKQIQTWSRIVVLLLLAYFFGTYLIGSGPRWDHRSDPISGLICVAILVSVIVISGLFPNLFGDESTGWRIPTGGTDYENSGSEKDDGLKNIIPIGRYAEDNSFSEETVYYTPEGDCYHKSIDCPSLSDSDYIYKAYKGDASEGHRPCGICY